MASSIWPPSGDDRYDGSEWPTAELRGMALDGQPGLEPRLALLLLGARDYDGRVADLARVLSATGRPQPLRLTAAALLGRIATPPAVGALRDALAADEPLVARAVAQALGWAGDRDSLPGLDRLARRGGSPAGAAAAAASLVRFRHGIGGDALPAARLLAPDPKASALIPVRAASRTAVDAALVDLRASAPWLSPGPGRALAFSCADGTSMVLPVSSADTGRAADRPLGGRRILAVVAERLAVEDGGWEVAQLVVTEPAGERRARIALVTPRGRLAMDGFAVIDGSDRARYVVTTVEAPGVVPAVATGSIEEGRIAIDRLEVGTERHRPQHPVRLRPGRSADAGAGRR